MDSLRKRFNPDGSMLRKQQLRMLDMLKYVDAICKQNNINYWLSSGTLLGAVRHGGFIPWDDDLDIEMLKKDYDKFVKVLSVIKNDNYVLQTHETDSNYLAPYAKLRDLCSELKETNTNDLYYKYNGIYIDIFILEPSSSYILTKFSQKIQDILYRFNRINCKWLRKFSLRLYYVFSRVLFWGLSCMTRINAKDQLRHVHGSSFTSPRYMNDLFPLKEIIFEDSFFPVPNNTDNYLKIIYGDYMALPDLDTVSNHVTKIEIYEK